MSKLVHVLRVVPRGAVAACAEDDYDDMDLDEPADLVLLSREDNFEGLRGTALEDELDRKEFESGHEASTFLAGLLRGTAGGGTDC